MVLLARLSSSGYDLSGYLSIRALQVAKCRHPGGPQTQLSSLHKSPKERLRQQGLTRYFTTRGKKHGGAGADEPTRSPLYFHAASFAWSFHLLHRRRIDCLALVYITFEKRAPGRVSPSHQHHHPRLSNLRRLSDLCARPAAVQAQQRLSENSNLDGSDQLRPVTTPQPLFQQEIGTNGSKSLQLSGVDRLGPFTRVCLPRALAPRGAFRATLRG